MHRVVRAWGKILLGYHPTLSIELTRECPLTCPGCYAYGENHLGGGLLLRQLNDRKGKELVEGVIELVRKHKSSEVSLIGGEPLVRQRELDEILPRLSEMGIFTQIVTSAVRTIPQYWAEIPNLQICVSIDGLQPEHDARRKPATYERILKNISGHQITVHCTVTRQLMSREGYLEEFVQFWSDQSNTKRIWMSLYTPQKGETSEEILTPEDRNQIVEKLLVLRSRYPKLDMPAQVIRFYNKPPKSPNECIFAQVTACVSADLERQIKPCQFGGNPDCTQCGCMASAGMSAIGDHRLPVGLKLSHIFAASFRTGAAFRWLRKTGRSLTELTPIAAPESNKTANSV
jgi:MoaA/NifB/PqqE/SkfB family radical SAM enzyme